VEAEMKEAAARRNEYAKQFQPKEPSQTGTLRGVVSQEIATL
jgi:hypothetical protein